MSSPPDARSHTIDITLDPPLSSAHEANLWVEEAGDGGDVKWSSPSRRPTLVLSRVDGGGVEQRFPLPVGTSLPPPLLFSFPWVFSITLHSLTQRLLSLFLPTECRNDEAKETIESSERAVICRRERASVAIRASSNHHRLITPPILPFHVSSLISYDARRRCRSRGNPRQAQEKRQDAEGHGADT